MQDSSQNPYIPQESEAIRQKVYERQSPLGRFVKWSLIATIIVAVLVGIGLFFVIPNTTAVDKSAREKLANALQPPDQVHKRVNVQSGLGFSLNYDNRVYSSYAEVGDSSSGSDSSAAVLSGQTYENNDLRVTRDYNYVRIRPIESVDTARALAPIPPQMELFATITDDELTKAASVPENKGLSKLSLFVKLDGDKRAAKKVADDKTIVNIEATKPVSTTIGSVEYQKVRYTTTNDNHRISNVKYDECYYTIQFDQPYSVCIANVRPTTVSAASLVEAVVDSITYEEPAVSTSQSSATTNKEVLDKNAYAYPFARLVQAEEKSEGQKSESTNDSQSVSLGDDETESPLITVTPTYYTDEASLKAIAISQPSVVRIGMLYCADLSLKFESGNTAATLTDACVGSVASGAIVSKDGYIATTGHAIRTQKKAAINGYINFAPDQNQMLDRLQRILDYLLKARIILQSDADYLKTGASIGDQEALAKIQNIASVIPDDFISTVKEEYSYAIQPTDKPIVINRNDTYKPTFAYSDSVLQAKYVASEYDAKKSIQEEFGSETPAADVGLLKVEGSFQEIVVAKDEDVKSNDMLSTIGYPAYTDSSLTIDKIRNMPVVTTSKVEQAYKKDGGRLIQTNMPVLPGNDGAPVIDANGRLIGFAVYGMSYCPDQLCFANGTVRSSAELLKLLNENNVNLQTGSPASVAWNDGVDEYMRANYSASADAFASAAKLYPFNRWATPLQQLATTLKDSAQDTSLMNLLQRIMIVSLIVLAAFTVVLSVAYVIHKRRITMLQVGHYGTSPTVATPTPAPTSPSPVPAAVIPPSPTTIPTSLPSVQQPSAPNSFTQQQPFQEQAPINAPVSPQEAPRTTSGPIQNGQSNQLPTPLQPPHPGAQNEDPFYK